MSCARRGPGRHAARSFPRTGGAAAPADPDAVTKGGLPSGMRVFVAVRDGPRDVPLVTARDASGAVLLVCEGRCAPPRTRGIP